MKITTLIENTAISQDFTAEHGLSLYIETAQHHILFDMGQTDAYLENAEKLGVDLQKVGIAILSHGHYDHSGGLKAFLALNDHARVYVSRHAFGAYYNGTEKYIGVDTALQNEPRLITADDEMQLVPGFSLHSCNEHTPVEPLNPYGLNKLESGTFLPDDFQHEHYLLIEDEGKRVLVSGCSHKGILNIASWFHPDVLIGGFHLMRQTDETELLRTADALLNLPTRYITGHCTGAEQYAVLKNRMGDRLDDLSAGKVIEI